MFLSSENSEKSYSRAERVLWNFGTHGNTQDAGRKQSKFASRPPLAKALRRRLVLIEYFEGSETESLEIRENPKYLWLKIYI